MNDEAGTDSPREASEVDARKEEILRNAARVFWAGMREARKLTPHDQAVAAHYAGGPSVDELERIIVAERASGVD